MKDIILLPTYNEKENIVNIIEAIFSKMPQVLVMVVDDNSPDGTGQVVKSLRKKYPNLSLLSRTKKEGLGKAYIHAIQKAQKIPQLRSIITMDADFSHHPRYLPEIIALAEKYDAVFASRYIKGGGTRGWEWWRKALSRYGNFYCRQITGMKLSDSTGGFNLMKVDILKRIPLSIIGSSGYAFQMELKFLLLKAGASFYEFPIIFENRAGGESKISSHIIREGLIAPWKMRFKKNVLSQKIKLIDHICVVCEHQHHNLFGVKRGFTHYECDNCKLLFIHPIPKSLKEVYDTTYFAGAAKGHGYVSYDQDKEAMKGIFKKYLKLFQKYLGRKGTLLDIGAATGYFMNIAKEDGWKVSGIEISPYAVSEGGKKGLHIVCGTLQDIDKVLGKGTRPNESTNKSVGSEKFDVITMFDVLEHVSNPSSDISHVRSGLKSGGLLVINTPDRSSWFARFLGLKWHLIIPPEHTHIFGKKSISELLDRSGFEIIKYTKIGKHFTLEYIAHTLCVTGWIPGQLPKKVLSFLIKHERIGQISIPLNLRDNMFIIARKR